MVSAIRKVTIGVSDMDEGLRLFRDLMHLRVEADYAASPSLRAAWGLAPDVEARLVELSCQGHPYGLIRLAAFTPTATERVRRDFGPEAPDSPTDVGPKAIDFYVRPPIREVWQAVQDAGYPVRSEPVLHEVGDTISEEFVAWGPDGVPLLFMVGHRHFATEMREGTPHGPFSEVPTVSIAAADLDASRRFYGEVLGLELIQDEQTRPEFIEKANALTGSPKGAGIHWLLYAEPGNATGKILVLYFGDATGKRLEGRMRPGRLGYSLLTHSAADLSQVQARAVAGGFAVVTAPTSAEIDGRTTRVMLLRGPNEDLYEIVEEAPTTTAA